MTNRTSSNTLSPDLPDCPDYLSRQRLDPTYAEQSYAQSDPALRARLKTAIAWHFNLQPEAMARLEQTWTGPDQAFITRICDQPARAAIFFQESANQAPARLLAALLPAILAGVPEIIVVCLGGQPKPNLCVALELAGVEQIFSLNANQAEAPEFLDWLQNLLADPEIRVLALGQALPGLAKIWHEQQAGPVAAPRNADPDFIALLRDLHAVDPLLTDQPEPDAAFFAGNNQLDQLVCAQVYGPGLEACWLHSNLNRAFFRTRRIRAQLSES